MTNQSPPAQSAQPEPPAVELIEKPVTDVRLAPYREYDSQIQMIVEACKGLTIIDLDDEDGAKKVDRARKDVKKLLAAIEKTRKELKSDSLELGKRIDNEAKRITAALEPTKLRLEAEEKKIADALRAIEQEKIEARKRKMQERINYFNAIGAPFVLDELYRWTDAEFEEKLAVAKAAATKAAEEKRERERIQAEAAAKLKAEQEELARERADLKRQQVALAAELAKQMKASAPAPDAADRKMATELRETYRPVEATAELPDVKPAQPAIDWDIDDLIQFQPKDENQKSKAEIPQCSFPFKYEMEEADLANLEVLKNELSVFLVQEPSGVSVPIFADKDIEKVRAFLMGVSYGLHKAVQKSKD